MAARDRELAFGAEYDGEKCFDLSLDIVEHSGESVEMDFNDYYKILHDIYGLNHYMTEMPLVIVIDSAAFEVAPRNSIPHGTLAIPKALTKKTGMDLPMLNETVGAATFEYASELTGRSMQ